MIGLYLTKYYSTAIPTTPAPVSDITRANNTHDKLQWKEIDLGWPSCISCISILMVLEIMHIFDKYLLVRLCVWVMLADAI